MVILSWGCKEKDILPSASSEGLNTFGVKIDGKAWLPKPTLSLGMSLPFLKSGYSNGTLYITARKSVNDEVLNLTIRGLKSEGYYALNSDEQDWLSATSYDGKYVDDDFTLYLGGINEVYITKLDTINKVAAGTFKCQLKGRNKQAILNFSEGVFDVKLD